MKVADLKKALKDIPDDSDIPVLIKLDDGRIWPDEAYITALMVPMTPSWNQPALPVGTVVFVIS